MIKYDLLQFCNCLKRAVTSLFRFIKSLMRIYGNNSIAQALYPV